MKKGESSKKKGIIAIWNWKCVDIDDALMCGAVFFHSLLLWWPLELVVSLDLKFIDKVSSIPGEFIIYILIGLQGGTKVALK